jgi:hypothetical protein
MGSFSGITEVDFLFLSIVWSLFSSSCYRVDTVVLCLLYFIFSVVAPFFFFFVIRLVSF